MALFSLILKDYVNNPKSIGSVPNTLKWYPLLPRICNGLAINFIGKGVNAENLSKANPSRSLSL